MNSSLAPRRASEPCLPCTDSLSQCPSGKMFETLHHGSLELPRPEIPALGLSPREELRKELGRVGFVCSVMCGAADWAEWSSDRLSQIVLSTSGSVGPLLGYCSLSLGLALTAAISAHFWRYCALPRIARYAELRLQMVTRTRGFTLLFGFTEEALGLEDASYLFLRTARDLFWAYAPSLFAFTVAVLCLAAIPTAIWCGLKGLCYSLRAPVRWLRAGIRLLKHLGSLYRRGKQAMSLRLWWIKTPGTQPIPGFQEMFTGLDAVSELAFCLSSDDRQRLAASLMRDSRVRPESVIPTSQQAIVDWPKHMVALGKIADEVVDVIGVGYRSVNGLYTAYHNVENVQEEICVINPVTGKYATFHPGKFEAKDSLDVCAMGVSNAIWSVLGTTSVDHADGYYGQCVFVSGPPFRDTNGAQRAVRYMGETLKPRNLRARAMGFFWHTASTTPGFSGAPIMRGGKVIGMHLASEGDGKHNRAVSAQSYIPWRNQQGRPKRTVVPESDSKYGNERMQYAAARAEELAEEHEAEMERRNQRLDVRDLLDDQRARYEQDIRDSRNLKSISWEDEDGLFDRYVDTPDRIRMEKAKEPVPVDRPSEASPVSPQPVARAVEPKPAPPQGVERAQLEQSRVELESLAQVRTREAPSVLVREREAAPEKPAPTLFELARMAVQADKESSGPSIAEPLPSQDPNNAAAAKRKRRKPKKQNGKPPVVEPEEIQDALTPKMAGNGRGLSQRSASGKSPESPKPSTTGSANSSVPTGGPRDSASRTVSASTASRNSDSRKSSERQSPLPESASLTALELTKLRAAQQTLAELLSRC